MAGALLALLSLSILTAIVEPHVHTAGRLVAHHDAAASATGRGHVEPQSPDGGLQPLCPLCAAQDAGRVVFALAHIQTAPALLTVPVAAPIADEPDGLHAGRSWRSRAPPLHV